MSRPAAALLVALAVALRTPPAGAVPATVSFIEVERDRITRDLAGATATAVSPDDLDVYVAAATSDAVVHFRWETPGLAWVGAMVGAAVPGLEGVDSVALSPDGLHVYAASSEVDSVVVLARDPGSGILAHVQTLTQGVGGVAGIAGASAVLPSADGAHVYVTGRTSNAVAVFSRDGGTGVLTFVAAHANGSAGITDLLGPNDLALDPTGSHAYVVGEPPATGAVVAFARDGVAGTLTHLQSLTDAATAGALRGAAGVALDGTGQHVYVAANDSDAVAVFDRNPATGLLAFVEGEFDGVAGVDGLNGAFDVAVSADGNHVYVSGAADAAVARFARAGGSGALTWLGTDAVGGRGLALSHDQATLYVTGQNALYARTRDAGTGLLSFRQTKQAGEPRSARVAADGAHVYTAVDADDALLIHARDAGTGALTFAGQVFHGQDGVEGLRAPRSSVTSPDGMHLYVTGHTTAGVGSVTVFTRDAGTGALSLVATNVDGSGGVTGLSTADGIAVSADGAHVYVTGSNAVVVFARDAGTGVLTWVETEADDQFGVDGLGGVVDVALSPGGLHLYAAGSNESKVAVFARDAGTGALSFVETIQEPGTAGASDVVVSSDGAYVYVAGRSVDAVASFARDPVAGTLTPVDVDFDDQFDVDGLNAVTELVITQGDGQVLGAAATDDALAVLSRDASSGALEFVHALFDGQFGVVAGLNGASALSLSPDEAHVYVTSTASGSGIAVFARAFGGCASAPAAGCRVAGAPDKSKMLIKNDADPLKDKVLWKWVAKGEGTTLADLGDPTTTTHYALCMYDASGPPVLILRALAPAVVHWSTKPAAAPRSLKYRVKFELPKEQFGGPEGIERMILKAGSPGKAKFRVQLKGAKASLPPMPLVLPVRVQLQSAAGECWEAEFLPPGVQRNDAGKFIARGG